MMATLYPLRPGEADCRDYLRTGRCKYGDSCKYNHPPNVDSGGGVRPNNPSEPLFPIRPTEPPCQYFLKHGTCKFGQSCKFNHPTGSSLVDGSNGLPAGQLVFVTSNAPAAMQASTSAVQVLPQKPTEPNCIYFLKNGKCKYGATCKFHHPLEALNRNNNQVQQHFIPNGRDRSPSAGSASEGRPQQMQQPQMYAPATNISYVQSAQRLQPITERARPQQATHVLLPDGQIAVILDPQSLQNVNEVNAQDRPMFYMSQTDGSAGTIPSMVDQNHNPTFSISPMLTASSNSNQTISSIDLMGTNASYQGQVIQGAIPRGPPKSCSGATLTTCESLDSDFAQAQQVSSQVYPRQMQPNLGQTSFAQYSAWPMNEGVGLSNQTQALRSPPRNPARQRQAVNMVESTSENGYFWPSNGSLSSATDRDTQAGAYVSMPNSSPYRSSNAVGQPPLHQSFSSERNAPISRSSSSDATRSRHGNSSQHPQESSGDDCEGLTMMTSALLTMMDRQDSPANMRRSATGTPLSNPSSEGSDVNYSQSAPDLGHRASPMRPPPGIRQPPGLSNGDSANFINQLPLSTSPTSGGYFVGGYDQASPRASPYGDLETNAL